METLTGTVDSIVYQSGSGDFAVFRLVPARESAPVTVVGNFPVPLVGEELELGGEWVEHSRFGRQFKAAACRRMAPSTVKGIERFLASGAIRGIGPATAARLVARFGERTLEMLENYPHRLTEVAGIGAKKAAVIRASFAERSELREIVLFLETHGVSGVYAVRIYKHYGAAALEILRQSPYQLAAEVDGIGFRTADHIALALGRDTSDPARLAAGIEFALLQTAQAGHCCLPEETLVHEAAKLLGADTLAVADTLAGLIRDNALHTEDSQGATLIYPGLLYHAETQVAARLRRLQARAVPARSADAEHAVAAWEEREGVTLAAAQREAVAAALRHGILILTGGPGTGKTVTIKGILAVLAEQGFKILLGAPTGRAAKRLGEACGREAATIHRLLEATGGREGAPLFMRDDRTPLDADVVIIDEASMIDITLMHYLLRAVPEGCRVVLVGDIDQLPAVGPGSVLKDIIRSGAFPVVRLSEVFRQAGESIIVVNAHRINRGLFPDVRSSADFQFRELADEAAVADAIILLTGRELPAAGYDPLTDIQVLSPMHRQHCGVENLNHLLQAALNPPDPARPPVGGGAAALRLGDKVMQTRNNYNKGVFNGDIGFIVGADTGIAVVRYPDGDILYERGELDELVLAYAMSVHKSQGSEYPVVVMPLVAGHYIMLQRNLLYTAVTRAKQRVILLGAKAALNTALANDRTRRRYSLLAERLRGEDTC
jgi:exodeoxyribonuclease V alpha subunit